MSKVRNISGGTRWVTLLDREVGDGEIVEVPDFQIGAIARVAFDLVFQSRIGG